MKKWARVTQNDSYTVFKENVVPPHWSSQIQAMRRVPLVIVTDG